ncbi:hypothetical protein QUC31_001732, partial [Theobroma cacao]
QWTNGPSNGMDMGSSSDFLPPMGTSPRILLFCSELVYLLVSVTKSSSRQNLYCIIKSSKHSGTTLLVPKPVFGYKSRYRHFVAVPSLTETSSINQIQYPVIIQFKEHITPIAVHFWAPTFKWRVSIANVADFAKPPEKISYPQQIAATCTGLVWSRYSTVINPKNWNLFSVNIALSGTGSYQLSRKNKKDYFSEGEVAAMAKE